MVLTHQYSGCVFENFPIPFCIIPFSFSEAPSYRSSRVIKLVQLAERRALRETVLEEQLSGIDLLAYKILQ
jgi:hypothetical protein